MRPAARARRPPQPRAFTLVELVVVIVLIAVLAGMTVPRMGGRASAEGLYIAARQVFAAARYARDLAVTRRCESQLQIDVAGRRHALAWRPVDLPEAGRQDSSGAGDEFSPLPTTAVKPRRLPDGVRWGRIRIRPSWPGPADLPEAGRPAGDSAEGRITFRPDGQSDAAIIELTDGERTYSVLILPETGRARLVEGPVEDPPQERVDLDEQ